MISERELAGLLYRADWTRLTLSGTVTGDRQVADFRVTVESDGLPVVDSSEPHPEDRHRGIWTSLD